MAASASTITPTTAIPELVRIVEQAIDSNDHDTALHGVQSILQLEPDHIGALTTLAELLLAQGESMNATKVWPTQRLHPA